MTKVRHAYLLASSAFTLPFLYLLFFLSGAAALGYQIAWLKMFATGLGHELPAALAVVGAFMAGMALGAWGLDKRIAQSKRPGRWYAMLEMAIGLWAFLSSLVIPLVNRWALPAIGLEPSPMRHWAVGFGFPFFAIFPATAAMGASLPAMERFVAPLTRDGRCVGTLYAVNTMGAVAGILLSTFLLLPAFGLSRAVWCFGLSNLICAAIAWSIDAQRQQRAGERDENIRDAKVDILSDDKTERRSLNRRDPQTKPAGKTGPVAAFSNSRLRITIFVTGLLGIGYEAVGIRVLSQVLENTIYTFAAVLTVFLLGTAAGAACSQRWVKRFSSAAVLAGLLFGLSSACLAGVLALSRAQWFYDICRSRFGDGTGGVLLAEMAVAATVFGLPTMCMGAIFSQVVQAARRQEGGVGETVALNTFGGALAPAVFGVILLPALGSKWTLVLLSFGYLALLPKLVGWPSWLLAPLALSVFVLPANLHLIQVSPGGELVEYREGIMDSVAVIQDVATNKTLRVNNRFQMGGTLAADAEYRHAHIPLLLHPAPTRALFLGLGTGITFGAASLHPNLESDGVELLPEVLAVIPRFEPQNFAPGRQPALKLHLADARRFVRATTTRYDVIVADLFHPARDGAGSLYTLEHFQAIRERLSPGGIFCQWLPLHQLDEEMLGIIIRTFLEVFPEAQAYLLRFNVDAPVIGLMACSDWPRYSTQWVENHLRDGRLEQQMKKLALADSIRFFGNLIAGPKELRALTAKAPLNTDDRPRIAFGAPRFTYRKNATSYGRLMALLQVASPDFADVLKLPSEANSFARRLKAYASARDVYLKGLIAQSERRPAQALDAFVESARLSEDFTSGYAQCLTIASLEAKADPDKARTLLQRLVQAQPARSIASEMLQRLEK